MSSVTFLKTSWPDLYKTAREAEQNINRAPRTGFDSAQPPLSARCSRKHQEEAFRQGLIPFAPGKKSL